MYNVCTVIDLNYSKLANTGAIKAGVQTNNRV
jgi:hypothetical protein